MVDQPSWKHSIFSLSTHNLAFFLPASLVNSDGDPADSNSANARVILAKMGHGPHSSKLLFVLTLLVLLFYGYFILFYIILYYSMYYFYIILCIVCVYMCTNHCHRVFTQLQLTNISISIKKTILLGKIHLFLSVSLSVEVWIKVVTGREAAHFIGITSFILINFYINRFCKWRKFNVTNCRNVANRTKFATEYST
jgi:hypothetical protein